MRLFLLRRCRRHATCRYRCRIHVHVVELLLQLRLCEVYWIVFTEVDDMFCLVAFVAILWSTILFSSILQCVRTLTVKLTDAVME